MYSVLFRADGSNQIGLGHIMRSITLAKELRRQNLDITFVSRYGPGIEKITAEGFHIIQLADTKNNNVRGSYYGNIESRMNEIEELYKLLNQKVYDLIVIDSYNISEGYFESLKRFSGKIAYIDDLNSFDYNTDIIINGNINAYDLNYKRTNEKQVFLLGLEYCLLREEFRRVPKRVLNKAVSEILITTGGGDPHNLSPVIAEEIISNQAYEETKINIVIGKAFENKYELYKLREENHNITLHEGINNLSELMIKCDLAISSGGSTLYELSACGTPTIAMILADNQSNIVKKMEEKGCVANIGEHNRIKKADLLKVIDFYRENYLARVDMSSRMQSLIDGTGAERVANILRRTLEECTDGK